jgi:hypothetical protein
MISPESALQGMFGMDQGVLEACLIQGDGSSSARSLAFFRRGITGFLTA